MKRFFTILLRTLLVILAVILVGAGILAGRWLLHRQDPTEFLPDTYTAYVQVPSLRALYDRWLRLAAADVVLARPDLAPYRAALADVRGLALTRSPVLGTLLDVRADLMLLPQSRMLAVVDLGWRGMFTPLARFVGPLLAIPGFSFLNDAGLPLYRFTSGGATINVAFFENIAVVSLDPEVVKQALQRRATDSGLAAKASRELLRRIRLRSRDTLRVLVDTRALSSDLLSSDRWEKAPRRHGRSRPVDARRAAERRADFAEPRAADFHVPARARKGAGRPAGAPGGAALRARFRLPPVGDQRRAPLRPVQACRGIPGQGRADLYARADAGARSVIGAGLDELLFSWVGSEWGHSSSRIE